MIKLAEVEASESKCFHVAPPGLTLTHSISFLLRDFPPPVALNSALQCEGNINLDTANENPEGGSGDKMSLHR